jgi:hypothetical protein
MGEDRDNVEKLIETIRTIIGRSMEVVGIG